MKGLFLCLVIFLISLAVTPQAEAGGNELLKRVPREKWQLLANKKIFFGHQSVGFNILSGIKAVMADHPDIRLHIVETRNEADLAVPIFAHSRIGNNTKPLTKIEDFAQVVEQGIGGRADLAFFKFCYVDVNSRTNEEHLFAAYKEKMALLRRQYPTTTFIHVTMPLTVLQSGPKAWVKRAIGRPIGGELENVKRNRFNRRLLTEYQGREPVFDLATLEAKTPSGLAEFKYQGKNYLCLADEFSSDGSHLNQRGARTVAEGFLIFLTSLM